MTGSSKNLCYLILNVQWSEDQLIVATKEDSCIIVFVNVVLDKASAENFGMWAGF